MLGVGPVIATLGHQLLNNKGSTRSRAGEAASWEALAQAIGIRTLTTPSQAARPRPLCLLGNNSAERRSERGVAVHAKRGYR